MHYSAVNYYSLGRVYPRSRLREPYPRLKRKAAAFLFPPPSPAVTVDFIRLVNESVTYPTILNESVSYPTISGESYIQ